ncbi:zinc finger protein-like 1 homolog isoform X2 [Copidosoma floridanum]|uniref:zinc finger protein-like 1 homolog isoform X2 n=1 Tax=Copidosoma floridanum TaxID=29053 RepID=UPI0006C9D617|nr:zinc finger protein-like 1 homolog isoform X2 [Copidosoma floridanum]
MYARIAWLQIILKLTCYHVYHWACLDDHCRSLPESQSSSNYVCPACTTRIIPQPNLVSPVADVLREKLAGVNWARSAQGLPLLSDEKEEKPEPARNVVESENGQSSFYQNHATSSVATSRTSSMVTSSNSLSNNVHSTSQKLGPPYSVVNMESDSGMSSPTVRRVFESYDNAKDDLIDHDDFKYQRKSAVEWFLRWWKLITRQQAQRRNSQGSFPKRYVILVVVIIAAYVLITLVASWLGRMATDGDPSFDPKNNPLVNVNENSN